MKNFVLFLITFSSVALLAQSVTTQFAANNSFAGNTFDVVSTDAVTIDSFDCNIGGVTTQTVAVYYKLGTSVGFENTSGAWTLLGTDSAVTPAGVDLPTAVAVGGLAMDPGQVYGIYVDLVSYATDGSQPGDHDEGTDGTTDGGGSNVNYTNGGPTVYSNGVFSITTNTGQASPAFSGSFFPREWNGTVYYSPSIVIPTMSQTMLIVFSVLLGIAGVGLAMRRRLAA